MTDTSNEDSTTAPGLLVEVRPQSGAIGNMSRPLPEQFGDRSVEIASTIAIVAAPIQDQAEQLAKQGDSFSLNGLEVKFSIELQAEAGVFIAKTSATGTFEVTLKWTKK